MVTSHTPRTTTPGLARRRLIGLALVAVLITLGGETLWFAPLAPATVAPPRSPAPLPLAEVNPYGVNVFLHKEVDTWKKDKTLAMAVEGGAGWIKQQFPWAEIEFKKGYFWDERNSKSSWAKFDEIVDGATRHGLRVIARLDRAPAWARSPGSNDEAPPMSDADFGDFIYAFVQHYNVERKTPINFLQIWNEPNLAGEWYVDQTVNPAAYVALLQEAARRARAADPNVVILAAPLATTLDMPPSRNLNELIYLDEMYKAGAQGAFDIMTANAYGLDRPPDDPPDPHVLNFRRVELLRQVMEHHGDSPKPIWFNEYGWNAPDNARVPNPTPGSRAPNSVRRWGSVTLAEQAEWTEQGIAYARAHWPWAGVFTIWFFRQVGDIAPDQAEYYFQMVNPDWVAQPVYNRIQAAAQEGRLAGPGAYGGLAAPVLAGPSWKMGRDAATGGLTLVSTVPSDTIRIHFGGTDLAVVVAPPAPGASGPAPRLYVTVDGSTAGVAAALPRDNSGRPYLDGVQAATTDRTLASSNAVRAAELPGAGAPLVQVVAGLASERAPATHVVELTADQPGVVFAGFVVRSERSYLPFAATTGALLALLVTLLIALRRTAHTTAV